MALIQNYTNIQNRISWTHPFKEMWGTSKNLIQYSDKKWKTVWNMTLFNIKIKSEKRHKKPYTKWWWKVKDGMKYNPIQYSDKKWRTA